MYFIFKTRIVFLNLYNVFLHNIKIKMHFITYIYQSIVVIPWVKRQWLWFDSLGEFEKREFPFVGIYI